MKFTVLDEAMELSGRFVFNPREGIDNPAMVTAEDAEGVSSPRPRVCVLKKEERENFGFHLSVEKGHLGHVIRQVEAWGVAERSGLKDGDRLLEVNDFFVDNLEHTEIARRIQLSGAQVCLVVLSGEEYERAIAQGWNLKDVAKAQRGEHWSPPRLCHITKDPTKGLGISIMPVEGEKGKFTVTPVSGGPAEKAGVKKGDRLVWINGAMACELTHSAISKMVKKCSDHMTVLVINSESERRYSQRKIPILPAMADAQNMPHQPRRVHMVKGHDGYGFFLKQERNSAGRRVHMLREVDAGSPAEVAGVKDGELLLEVNRELIDHLSHEDVVSRFRESGNQVTLTTITVQGQDFYTRLGLSPLLFCEDLPSGKEEQDKSAQKESPVAVTFAAPQQQETEPSARLCVLKRGPLGFGFHLGSVQHKPGIFISQVTAGEPGEGPGLLQGDIVVEVNGQNVEDKHLEDVILLMKEGGTSLSMLVIDQAGYEWKKKDGRPITAPKEIKNSEGKKSEIH